METSSGGEGSTPSKHHSPASVAEALARLNDALDRLDGAVSASRDNAAQQKSPDEEIQHMNDDRAKLARELDVAEARANRLTETNSEVSRRLVGAMEMVRGVLDKQT